MIRIIPNGVDTLRFDPARRPVHRAAVWAELGRKPDGRMVLFVAHEFERKGLEPLIDAMAQIAPRCPELVLVVLGRDNPARYRRLAADLGIADRVHFPGARSDVERFMAAADLFVLPTNYEAFPLVVLEAMASGVPVLACAVGGIRDCLVDGVNGLVIERDAQSTSGRMAVVLANAQLATRLGAAARASALQLSWDAVAEQYEALLNDAYSR